MFETDFCDVKMKSRYYLKFSKRHQHHMKHTISTQGGVGCSLLVLREGWEAQCYYVGWGERILRSEGWKVVLIVKANG